MKFRIRYSLEDLFYISIIFSVFLVTCINCYKEYVKNHPEVGIIRQAEFAALESAALELKPKASVAAMRGFAEVRLAPGADLQSSRQFILDFVEMQCSANDTKERLEVRFSGRTRGDGLVIHKEKGGVSEPDSTVSNVAAWARVVRVLNGDMIAVLIDEFLQLALLKAGLAWHTTKYYFDDAFMQRLEDTAKANRVGLWSEPTAKTDVLGHWERHP